MRASFKITALAAALLVTQQACAATGTTAAGTTATPVASGGLGSSPPAPSAAPSPSVGKTTKPPQGGGAKFTGKTQYYFFVLDKKVEVPESLLAATSDGKVEVNGDFSGKALFVPVPAAPGSQDFLIKTGQLRRGGEALCLQVKRSAVVTAACDAADRAQIFRFDNLGKDNQGRTTYGISSQGAHLQWDPNGTRGLIAEEVGDAPLDTTWVAIDRGASTVPVLD